VPEWLWRDPRYVELIPPTVRAAVDRDLKRIESMRALGETPAVLRKERALARKLTASRLRTRARGKCEGR
jgi:hypothetical protein